MRRVVQIVLTIILVALLVLVERGLAPTSGFSLHELARVSITAVIPLILALAIPAALWRGEIAPGWLVPSHDEGEARYWRPGWLRVPPSDPRDTE